MLQTTPVYGITWADPDTPLRQIADVTQKAAETIEAALIRGGIAPADVQALIASGAFTDSGWTTAPLRSGFVPNNAGLQVRKIGKRVQCRYGVGSAGLALSTDTIVADIPVGFRPPPGHYIGSLGTNNVDNRGRSYVESNGAVHVVPGGTAVSTYFRWDDVSWLID